MEYHLGRLIDHIHLRVSDLEKSRHFYESIFQSLGRELSGQTKDYFYSDELFVTPSEDYVSRIHIALQANSKEEVDQFYKIALETGGKDNGAPGERDYHPGYYGAFVFDPDGNNIEAVWHGKSERSSPSVKIEPIFEI